MLVRVVGILGTLGFCDYLTMLALLLNLPVIFYSDADSEEIFTERYLLKI